MVTIEFRSVSYRYPGPGGRLALEDVSLNISPGELLFIVGPNGSGKSTLIKHMNGILKPTRGTVLVDGVDTKRVSVAELSRKVGIVFQNPDHQLFASTVLEELAFGPRNFGLKNPEGAARTAAGRLGISHLLDRPPQSLSWGEKKRVSIAAVLSWDPEALVLDEPTVGQDGANVSRIGGIVKALVAEGRTVVIASHDVEFLWSLRPRRVVVMEGGKMAAEGPAEDVLADESLVRRAKLLMPQAVELALRLGTGPAGIEELVEALRAWRRS